jgi:hypothetical protein
MYLYILNGSLVHPQQLPFKRMLIWVIATVCRN